MNCARILVALCATGFCVSAAAQPYPARPVRIVVPFAAGSATDTVARVMGQNLSEVLGQPFVIDNRAGANGAIGAELAAKATPDGYTLFMSTNTPSAANPSLMKHINYDPVKDFAPITRIGTIPFVLVVHPSVPAKSVRELIELAKQQPGKLTFGSGSSGSMLPGFMLQQMAGIVLNHVPYKSIPPALTDAIGGQITMVFADLVTGTPQIKSGKVRALGVTSQKRAVLLPEVPAIAETLPGFELIAWFALFTNAQARDDIPARLNAESAKILARPDVRDRFAVMGIEVAPTTRAELAAFVKSEIAKWARLTKAAGMLPE
ncbi:MAG TPA: tripartite tricarboxylate transporter substrate binding protein [Burkholderiales bacterium]|jgi:tripartite-type tricarboxylate transporter receptor subunit TctC|nr:tripartite tricarboxylate transporter substrate binding protein [Burkholderiales bacterium]